jgi:hypothetical protein
MSVVDGAKTHKTIYTRSVALSVCLIGGAVPMLGAALDERPLKGV